MIDKIEVTIIKIRTKIEEDPIDNMEIEDLIIATTIIIIREAIIVMVIEEVVIMEEMVVLIECVLTAASQVT